MKTGDTIGIILIDDEGFQFGQADYTRWEKTKWYQRILGYFFYSYKKKFIDIKPFTTNYKGNGTYECYI